MRKKGLLFVISGPSGVGKGTICKGLLRKDSLSLCLSISVTTRLPRSNEEHGKNYFFIDDKEFKSMIDKGELLEWAEVYGNYYGTPRKWVEKKLESGCDVLLEIDVQGALQVKSKIPESILIFILPPTINDLKERLKSRNTDSDEVISNRLKHVKDEIEKAVQYDYIVINDFIGKVLERVASIMIAEKCRAERFSIEDYLKGSG
ncbi:guanylate kinase [Peptococcaceae bacterium]|nr:guanylate kinase [Peptococcaceae bacterium]MCL0052561.1 guanylate kinase [Peptococcaceae bacterium]MCL0077532.1 guanylate kinase [Peptococcaceae bacterium]